MLLSPPNPAGASMYDLSKDERAFIERRLAQERQAMAASDAVVRRRHEQLASEYERRLTSLKQK
jgi:hypothetical protein